MLTTLTLLAAASLTAPPACTGAAESPGARGPDLEALYGRGRTYQAFQDAAVDRRAAWRDHYATAAVPDALRRRVEAVPRRWRLLVVAEDWCGDSANTIPYVARLVDLSPNLELRIVGAEAGGDVMRAHRTPDGRAATPTVLLLDERFEEAGCWVERPAPLQEWFLAHEDRLEQDELYRRKYEWYAEDAGATTLEEFVRMIESAAAGRPICAG